MTQYTLYVNGVELAVRDIQIKKTMSGPLPEDESKVELRANDCIAPTEDINELVESLKVEHKATEDDA